MTSNQALADELEAVNSIYDADALKISGINDTSTLTILSLPKLPFSFNLAFPTNYPDVPPQLDGIQSTGSSTRKGDGEIALGVLRDVLGRIYVPGQVCLFDLIEETTPLLETSSPPDPTPEATPDTDAGQHDKKEPQVLQRPGIPIPEVPTAEISNLRIRSLAAAAPTTEPSSTSTNSEPAWTLSQPMLVSKSSFVARALHVRSLAAATTAISHLLSTNKKVATATHNITAWRIRLSNHDGDGGDDGPEVVIQDCDDDGETAAGGRLLHLMQLMDVWDCVVVVTRWYGGVKLGPDRFRCINMVARDAMVRGGFAKDDATAGGGSGAGGGKGKKGRKGG